MRLRISPANLISGPTMRRVPELLMLIGIVYVVASSFPLMSLQSSAERMAEVVLMILFLSTALLRRHLFGIGRRGLPSQKGLDCQEMKDDYCLKECHCLKSLLINIEQSKALRSRSGIAWRLGSYSAGVGGIALALMTSVGVPSALGVLFALPSVLDWAKERKTYWKHWQEKVDELKRRWSWFVRNCLHESGGGTSSD